MNAREVFEDTYQAHKGRLLALAAALSGDRAAAEDIVHDVFALLVGESWRLRDNGSLPGWLTVCVRNRAHDWRRKVKRHRTHASGILTHRDERPSDSSTQQAGVAEEQEMLLGLVSGLPGELREVVGLHIWGHLTFAEIAHVQKTSKSTAHERYSKALQELRTQFMNKLRTEFNKGNQDVSAK